MPRDAKTLVSKYTLDEFIAVKDNPQARRYAAVAQLLLDRGYTGDYRMGYNVQHNAEDIASMLPSIGGDDLVWLSNQIGSIFSGDTDYVCCDNFRLCSGIRMAVWYRRQRDSGCCGSYDKVFTNPQTGNSFCYGFNYGH